MNNRNLFILVLFVLNTQQTVAQSNLDEKQAEAITTEAMAVTKQWIESWNGAIDPDKMMAVYHTDNKYIWRGMMPYPVNKEGINEFFVGQTNYLIELVKSDITILNPNTVIVFIHFRDANGDAYGTGAASLVITKENNAWKVKYVHESEVKQED